MGRSLELEKAKRVKAKNEWRSQGRSERKKETEEASKQATSIDRDPTADTVRVDVRGAVEEGLKRLWKLASWSCKKLKLNKANGFLSLLSSAHWRMHLTVAARSEKREKRREEKWSRVGCFCKNLLVVFGALIYVKTTNSCIEGIGSCFSYSPLRGRRQRNALLVITLQPLLGACPPLPLPLLSLPLLVYCLLPDEPETQLSPKWLMVWITSHSFLLWSVMLLPTSKTMRDASANEEHDRPCDQQNERIDAGERVRDRETTIEGQPVQENIELQIKKYCSPVDIRNDCFF